eukprot:13729775-Alexandrium_andersonii.AAC.1
MRPPMEAELRAAHGECSCGGLYVGRDAQGRGVCNQPWRRRIRAENYARQVHQSLRLAREQAANARAEQRRSRARVDAW